jgi:hypothetical protein
VKIEITGCWKMVHMSIKEKMKGMTGKEKAQYIWEYYKLHMLVTIILVGFIGSYAYYAAGNTPAELNITIIGGYIEQGKIEALQNKVTAELIKDKKNKREIIVDFLGGNGQQLDLNTQMKLSTSVAAKEIDILILDKKHFESFADQGAFMKLSSIPVIAQLNIPDSNLVKCQPKNSNGKTDGKEDIYGINVEDMPTLKDLGYDTKDSILCVLSNTKRPDKVETFLKWFFT